MGRMRGGSPRKTAEADRVEAPDFLILGLWNGRMRMASVALTAYQKQRRARLKVVAAAL